MSGLLEAESKLPSLRKMCSDIGVSHMTMVKVYSALEENGWSKNTWQGHLVNRNLGI